jgi:hypothetical protein
MTEAGRALLAALDRQREGLGDTEAYPSQRWAQQDALAYAFVYLIHPAIAAIEAEAREGYVPASLSPEWKAELAMSEAEGREFERERIAAAVEAELAAWPELYADQMLGRILAIVQAEP